MPLSTTRIRRSIQWCKEAWMGRFISFILPSGWLALSLYVLVSAHAPGIAIGLLAFAAGIISIRPEMGFIEKLCWAVIMGIFLKSEIGSIHRDRQESDQKASEDRKTQQEKFSAILERQNADFLATTTSLQQNYKQNQDQFQLTVNKLNASLRAEQITLQQTRPKAFVQVQVTGLTQAGFRPFPHWIHVTYENKGQETARKIFVFGMPFVASADKSAAKAKVEVEFNKAWSEGAKNAIAGSLMAPNDPLEKDLGPFFPEMQDRSALSNLVPMNYRVYIVVRTQFSDSSGTWFTDHCERMEFDPGAITNCGFLGETRYPSGALAAKSPDN